MLGNHLQNEKTATECIIERVDDYDDTSGKLGELLQSRQTRGTEYIDYSCDVT
jgi:hypothetical protein